MNYKVSVGRKTYDWADDAAKTKLENLGKAKEGRVWVKGNLDTKKSSAIGRFFWKIARHFNWMRKLFYGIDLKKSKTILNTLKGQIASQKNQKMMLLFDRAVEKLNRMMGRTIVSPLEAWQGLMNEALNDNDEGKIAWAINKVNEWKLPKKELTEEKRPTSRKLLKQTLDGFIPENPRSPERHQSEVNAARMDRLGSKLSTALDNAGDKSILETVKDVFEKDGKEIANQQKAAKKILEKGHMMDALGDRINEAIEGITDPDELFNVMMAGLQGKVPRPEKQDDRFNALIENARREDLAPDEE